MSSSRQILTAALFAALIVEGAAASAPISPRAAASIVAEAPLYFEAQDTTSFIARGVDCLVQLNATAAEITLSGGETKSAQKVRLVWLNATSSKAMLGMERLAGTANYLVGTDRANWRTELPLYGKVRVPGIYRGIDLVYYADQQARLEYDFVLQPGADVGEIAFRVEGADSVKISERGELVIRLSGEEIRQHSPVIFQEVNGARIPVSGGYRMIGRNVVGFRVGDYDRAKVLVIDPVLSFSTYIGRNKTEFGWGVAVDSQNNIYVVGETLSEGFASSADVFQRGYAGGIGAFGDAFVAKYDGTTRELVYRTYLGGRHNDGALAVAADSSGRAYVTGYTDSRNFPVVPESNAMSRDTLESSGRNNNAFRIFPVNVFVARLNATGTDLDSSVLLGGERRDAGTGIAWDADSGDVFVTGFSQSRRFKPVPNGFQNSLGGQSDAFVVRLTGFPDATPVYSTFLGGSNSEQAQAIAVRSGRAYVTGWTVSRDFPVLNALVVANSTWTNPVVMTNLNLHRGRTFNMDAFVTALNPAGTELVYSTYLGGTSDDSASDVDVDGAGNAYVTGYTYSRVFPTNTVVTLRAPARNFNSHAFVTKIDPAGGLVYSAEFGSGRLDRGTGIAVDEARQQVYVTGFTTANNFFATNLPVLDARTAGAIAKRSNRTPRDGFVVALQETAGGAPLAFTNAVLFGGNGNESPHGIALSSAGGDVLAWIAGQTTSGNLPTTNSYPPFEVQERLGNSGKGNRAPDAFLLELQFPPAP